MEKIKTLKVRVKDKHAKLLKKMAGAVNFVWNYINELSSRSIRERREFLSVYDIHKYTTGANKELGLHSQTLQCVAKEYVTARKQFKKSRLNWRKTKGVRRSLGWIPVNTNASRWKNGQVYYNGNYFSVWDSCGLSNYKFRTAFFNEDARGRWYFNVVVSVKPKQSTGTSFVGIDLGCKEAATDSNGSGVTGRNYRAFEQKLAVAQRAKNKAHAKAIHAKINNKRKDELHKYSRKLVSENAAIFVGNAKSAAIAKTKLAKSALDAGWHMLKTMPEYKCDHAGVVFEEVNEKYTTQTCSYCKEISNSSPKGRAGLGIREWVCKCGAVLNRDVNAARNILALGHERLVGGIPFL